jgi:hypothetical protein
VERDQIAAAVFFGDADDIVSLHRGRFPVLSMFFQGTEGPDQPVFGQYYLV